METPRCGCCGRAAITGLSAARSWCTTCELEFQRVLIFLEAAARVLRYSIKKSG